MPHVRYLCSRGPALTGEAGQSTIMIAVLMVALLGFAGMVIDYGQITNKHRQTQNAADAAAQSAAYEIYAGQSEATGTTQATTAIQQHGYTAGNLTTLQYLDASGQPTTIAANVQFVHSVVSETFKTLLLGLVGIPQATTNAAATVKTGSGTPPCVLCVLNPTKTGAMTNNGNPSISVTGGGIVVDSNAGQAAIMNGNPSVTASSIGIVGNYLLNGNPTVSPTPQTGIAPVPDPLANVPAPATSGPNYGAITLNGNGSMTIQPGIYSQIIVNGNGTLNLQPGTYVITGSLILNGNPTIIGTGVTVYFTCSGYTSTATQPCNGSPGAGLTLNGNPTYQLTAPTSGVYQGLTVFYDRTNTAGLTLNGNPSDNFTGTIYAKSAAATLNGNPAVNQINSLIVVDTVTLNGNGQLNIVYNQSQNYSTPIMPVFTQ